jgi:hypothetical protein
MRQLTIGILAFAAQLILVWGSPARAATAPAQKFDPAQCQYDDKACITGWYEEYSAGILAELKYYSGELDFVALMQRAPNETLINARLALVMIEGGMRFDQWVALKDDEAAKLAGLDMPRYRAISAECRDAVEAARDALFDLRQHRDKVGADLAKYRKDAAVCEKAFGFSLPRPNPPKPQAEDEGDREAAPTPGAAPMRITPVKARKPAR